MTTDLKARVERAFEAVMVERNMTKADFVRAYNMASLALGNSAYDLLDRLYVAATKGTPITNFAFAWDEVVAEQLDWAQAEEGVTDDHLVEQTKEFMTAYDELLLGADTALVG